MVALTPSPSPFATLLRRSKFSSFDPSIAQVYTVHDGDAHRGNWGFKRPLAVRRRGAYMTVKSMDTKDQQTEWNSAETQAKFMQRYQELNLEPYGLANELYDSEFAPRQTPEEQSRGITRNPIGMDPKQFRRYLEQMRAKRPEFIVYLREKGKTDPRIGNKSMFELAQQPDTNYHAQFLAEATAATQNNMESRAIERQEHRSGGLIYSRPSFLQTYLTTKPQPGRVIMDAIRFTRNQPSAYVVAFAGMTPALHQRHVAGTIDKMRWKDSSDPDRGIAQFRMMQPKIIAMPVVVGKRQGLKAMKLSMSVRNVIPAKEDIGRSNPYFLGSMKYVGAGQSPKGQRGGNITPINFDDPARVRRAARAQKLDKGVSNTIEILKAIIRKSAES